MANADAPRGFKPLGSIDSGDYQILEYEVDASNTLAIFKGDPLTLEADGNVKQSVANDGVKVHAVAVGFKNSDGQSISYLAGSTAGTVLGVPVKNQLFAVQADTGTAVVATARYATANHAVTAGDTDTGISKCELDSSDIGTGVQVRILDKVDEPNNSWAEHVDLVVEFTENASESAVTI
jgi:hypothetical protein|tara:strand:- start:776 stop:1315 length:540 start_codon:yes stop_codon:yes gene_type:complete